MSVIPAKAGIYDLGQWKGRICQSLWIPAFAGMLGKFTCLFTHR